MPNRLKKKVDMNKNFSKNGFTLIELMVAILIAVLIIAGSISFRYHAALHARKAEVHITAGRVGLMLLDAWKSNGARDFVDIQNTYDPLNFTTDGSEIIIINDVGPSIPAGFSSVGRYKVTVEGAYYYASLSYIDDIASDLRTLNIAVAWPEKYPIGDFSESDRGIKFSTKANLPN